MTKTTYARLAVAGLAATAALALAACAEPDKVEQRSSDGGAAASPAAEETKPAGSLLDTGFGQRDQYVHVIAIVQNTSDKVGQTVTVQFNVKDKAGQILASDSQVETFTQPGQKKPIATQVEVPKGKKAAKVDATLLVEDEGTFSADPFPAIKVGPVKVTKSEYGTGEYDARVEVTNPTGEPLESPRVDVVCYNAAKKIIGGGFTYEELIPPSDKAVVDMSTITSGKPASCTAYASPQVM